MASFNLLTKAWIPVLTHDGASKEISLLEALQDAEEISSISGNPLEAAVLYRLLLAIAHRAETPKDPGQWLRLWEARTSFLNDAAARIRANADKFDLYGGTRPFGQNPRLASQSRTPAEIVYDRAQGNNPVFLDGSVVSQPLPISSALAARSLLVTHAFGGSGTGGLNPLNGNKKDTMYAGPLCARMIALVEGKNLAETLLLNLVPTSKVGLPAWEREQSDVPKLSRSTGVCDIYTRTTRNALLTPSPDGEACLGVAVVMGEAILAEDGARDDPMIPLYWSKSDKKFKALRVDPAKAVWRNSQTLLIPEDSDTMRPLACVVLIRSLMNRGYLSGLGPVRLRTLGAAANAQGPVTEMWRDECLPFSIGLFDATNGYAALSRAVGYAEEEADNLRRQLYGFGRNYVANGGGSPDPKDVARLMDEIAPGLGDYWMEIGPDGERLAVSPSSESAWQRRLAQARQKTFSAAVNRLAPNARRMRAQFERGDSNALPASAKKGGGKT